MKKIKTIKTIITTVLMLSVFLTGCANGSVSEDTLNQSGDLSEIPEVFIVPEEQYVIKCLEQVDTINGIAAVTEDDDPNGKLNKKGGYISAVYFSSSLIQNNKFSERQLIEEGTSAGGCIEVFPTVEDANKRNEYLSEFDGSLFDSGFHKTIGTIVIRISNKLDDAQYKKLEEDIINTFISAPLFGNSSTHSSTTESTTQNTTESTTTTATTTATTTTTTATTKTTITTTTTRNTEVKTEKTNNNPAYGTMVWIPEKPGKYHSKSTCSGMKNSTQVTVSQAKALGYDACKRCY